jgi:hypothetical protein
MTKVGEGNDPPKTQTPAMAHQQLETSTTKFSDALSSYNMGQMEEEKKHLKVVMDEQLGLIRQAVSELKQKGIQKQEAKVEADYKEFMTSGSDESYLALEHDIQTLREYNNVADLQGEQ